MPGSISAGRSRSKSIKAVSAAFIKHSNAEDRASAHAPLFLPLARISDRSLNNPCKDSIHDIVLHIKKTDTGTVPMKKMQPFKGNITYERRFK